MTSHLFRRGVGDGPDERALLRDIRRRQLGQQAGGYLGQPEVEDLDPSVGLDDHVLGLQVAVDHVHAVSVRHAARDLGHDAQRLVDSERTGGEKRPEIGPGQELHRNEGDAIDLVDLVHHRDVRVGDRGRGARLANQPLASTLRARPLRGEDLERNATPEAHVLRFIDLAHSALADPREDPEVRDRAAGESGGLRLPLRV